MEVQVLEGIAPKSDYLIDLIQEIDCDTDILSQSVIASTETALWIQKQADVRER